MTKKIRTFSKELSKLKLKCRTSLRHSLYRKENSFSNLSISLRNYFLFCTVSKAFCTLVLAYLTLWKMFDFFGHFLRRKNFQKIAGFEAGFGSGFKAGFRTRKPFGDYWLFKAKISTLGYFFWQNFFSSSHISISFWHTDTKLSEDIHTHPNYPNT